MGDTTFIDFDSAHLSFFEQGPEWDALVQTVISQSSMELRALEQAWKTNDLVQGRQLIHSLRGSSSSVGGIGFSRCLEHFSNCWKTEGPLAETTQGAWKLLHPSYEAFLSHLSQFGKTLGLDQPPIDLNRKS